MEIPKFFKEYDIRGIYETEIDANVSYKLGRAFVRALGAKKIIVGQDRRPGSSKIMPAFVAGAEREGAQVLSLGTCSTPELFFAVGKYKLTGGVMVTASHSPAEYVGFKMIGASGVPLGLKTGSNKIIVQYNKLADEKFSVSRASKKVSIKADYYRAISSFVNKKRIGSMTAVLDASGGSGDELVDYVISRLPINTIKLNFKKGGKKIPHGLNPMLEENQLAAKTEVVKRKADLGIIWDGDADRCNFIDEAGNFIHPYYINCLLNHIIIGKKKNIGVVIDARMPVGLSQVIEGRGGKAIVSRSGTANVIEMMYKKKLLFGCENSGHYFFNFLLYKKNNYVYCESILPVLLILEYLSVNKLKFSEAIDQFKGRYFISGEINFKVSDFAKLKNKLQKKYIKYPSKEIDGLSVFGGDWFFNVRPSNTEPLARMNIEAGSRKKVDQLLSQLKTFI